MRRDHHFQAGRLEYCRERFEGGVAPAGQHPVKAFTRYAGIPGDYTHPTARFRHLAQGRYIGFRIVIFRRRIQILRGKSGILELLIKPVIMLNVGVHVHLLLAIHASALSPVRYQRFAFVCRRLHRPVCGRVVFEFIHSTVSAAPPRSWPWPARDASDPREADVAEAGCFEQEGEGAHGPELDRGSNQIRTMAGQPRSDLLEERFRLNETFG